MARDQANNPLEIASLSRAALLSEAGQRLATVLALLTHLARPGTTPASLNQTAQAKLASLNCRSVLPSQSSLPGQSSLPSQSSLPDHSSLPDQPSFISTLFPAHAAISVNSAVANAIPSSTPLCAGDLVTIDIAMRWPASGPHFEVIDAACALVVLAEPSPAHLHDSCAQIEQQPLRTHLAHPNPAQLLRACRATLRVLIQAISPGITPATLRRIAHACAQSQSVQLANLPLLHGVSRSNLHVHLADHAPLQSGDLIAIEPVVLSLGESPDLITDADGFTLRTASGSIGVSEERTVLVGDDQASPSLVVPVIE